MKEGHVLAVEMVQVLLFGKVVFDCIASVGSVHTGDLYGLQDAESAFVLEVQTLTLL